MAKARLTKLERALSDLHTASMAVALHREAHSELEFDGTRREIPYKVSDKKGKPLLSSVDGVVVLNDDVMYNFTLAVKFYDGLKSGHQTKRNFLFDLMHNSYENVRSFYYSEEYSEMCRVENEVARRQVA